MKKQNKDDPENVIKQSGIDLADVPSVSAKIKQSARTTFSLSNNAQEGLATLCIHFGLKQKDLIDDWIVPTASWIVSDEKWRNFLSEESFSEQKDGWVRKSFVCSKSSIKKLNALSEEAGISRDVLFVMAVSVQKLILDKRHEKHQEALEIIENLYSTITDVENKLIELLGDDDPIPSRVRIIGVIMDNLLMAISAEINKGIPIDPEDFSQQG